MSKSIVGDMILTSASTRVDGSLSLRLSTAELQPAEKTVFFELMNKHLRVLLQPIDETPEAMVEVKQILDFPSPSKRLRSVLFVEWSQKKPDMTFDEFYTRTLESIISSRKERLEPQT